MAKEETKEAPQKKWAVGQVPTATKEVIVNTETQQPLIAEEGIALVLNEIEEIKETLNKILKKLD
jgi:CMP-2-keto-3-deoxyoctulosonic acid synthetase